MRWLNRAIHTSRTAPSSWVARIALAAALLGSAIVTFVIGFFDPFGQRHATADAASRQTVAVVLCSIVDVQEQRVRAMSTPENVRRAMVMADELRALSRSRLGYECGPEGRASEVDERSTGG